jgi:hypothetical protein
MSGRQRATASIFQRRSSLGDHEFKDDSKVKTAVTGWLTTQDKNFCQEGTEKLAP